MTQPTIAQTSYTKFFFRGVPGSLFDISEYIDIITGTDIAAADVAGIPFGLGIVLDTGSALPHEFTGHPNSNKLVKLPAASGDLAFPVFLGVALFTQLIENDAAFFPTAVDGYPQNRPISVLHKGRVVVKPEVAVVVGDPVYCRYAANGGNTQPGSFSNAGDAGNAQVATARWYLGTDSASGLAVLELNS